MDVEIKVETSELEEENQSTLTIKDDDSADSGMNVPINKKRKLHNEPSSSKKQRVANSEVEGCRLKTLSEDILLIILSYLPQDSLLHLKKTCKLFSRICQDFTLWRNVDCTERALSEKEFQTIPGLVSLGTTSIKIGNCELLEQDRKGITAAWLTDIKVKCENLNYLGLISQSMDAKTVSMQDFPSCLTALDLSGTTLANPPATSSYFKDISVFIPNLKILKLARCKWFNPHSLMAISKCKRLEELILTDCKQVKDCLAYCGLSTRVGFPTLQTLDIRRCPINASEALCFVALPSLKNLYLENAAIVDHCTTLCINSVIESMCSFEPQGIHRLGNAELVVYRKRPNNHLERLAIRHFRLFNDQILLKLAEGARCLTFLDVTGCAISIEGAMQFMNIRPHVTMLDELRSFTL